MTDQVNNPDHYQIGCGIEAKDIIRAAVNQLGVGLTPWQVVCLANFLKYRLRAGDKDDLQQDIDKSNVYRDMLRHDAERRVRDDVTTNVVRPLIRRGSDDT